MDDLSVGNYMVYI